MPAPPPLSDLRHAPVTITDPYGEQARFTLDHAGTTMGILTYLFRGKRTFPLRIVPGDTVTLGAAHVNGWLVTEGKVLEATLAGTITAEFGPLALTQRRAAYREEIVLTLRLRTPGQPDTRGRTVNLSLGGFATRSSGTPLPPGTTAQVEFDLPDGTVLVASCEKIGGDIAQRFRFLDLDMRSEDKIISLIREAELDRRRSAKNRPL